MVVWWSYCKAIFDCLMLIRTMSVWIFCQQYHCSSLADNWWVHSHRTKHSCQTSRQNLLHKWRLCQCVVRPRDRLHQFKEVPKGKHC